MTTIHEEEPNETTQVPVEGEVPQTQASGTRSPQNKYAQPRYGPAAVPFANKDSMPMVTVPATTRQMSPNELVAQPPGFSNSSQALTYQDTESAEGAAPATEAELAGPNARSTDETEREAEEQD